MPAALFALWLWDRLALPVSLPTQVYLWIAAAGCAAVWFTRGLVGKWRCFAPAVITVAPLAIALFGTPLGDVETLALLAGMVATATIAHGFIAPFFGANARELGRWWLLSLAALWLAEPLFTSESNGAGDAQWYSLVLADAIAQWKAGFFPPFVGQSEFAVSGSRFSGGFGPFFYGLRGV